MQLRLFLFLTSAFGLLALLNSTPTHAQAMPDFVTRAAPLAVKSQRETAVPASVTLAQAIWETGRGRSPIGDANNFFGIKATGSTDDSVNVGPIAAGWVWAWTREWDGKRFVASRERFRKYASMEDSFRDHGLLLATTPRYAEAMRAVDDPREFARRIAAAGYATSPTYAADLIRLMDQENLYRFDLPRNAAEFLGQSEYLTVAPGEIFQIYFDLQNSGFGTWSPSAGYALASVNGNPFGALSRQPLDGMVRPGANKRWAITMVAPREPGDYRTAWQMKHGEASFGPELYIQVQVKRVETPFPTQFVVGGALFSLGVLGCLWLVMNRQRKQKSRGGNTTRGM